MTKSNYILLICLGWFLFDDVWWLSCASYILIELCVWSWTSSEVFYQHPSIAAVLQYYHSNHLIANHLLKETLAYSFEAWEIERDKKKKVIHRGTGGISSTSAIFSMNYDFQLIKKSAASWNNANGLFIYQLMGEFCERYLLAKGAIQVSPLEKEGLCLSKEECDFYTMTLWTLSYC